VKFLVSSLLQDFSYELNLLWFIRYYVCFKFAVVDNSNK